jgi:hypothetical protein
MNGKKFQMRFTKRFLVLFAAGLLVWGAQQGLALAQSTGGVFPDVLRDTVDRNRAEPVLSPVADQRPLGGHVGWATTGAAI